MTLDEAIKYSEEFAHEKYKEACDLYDAQDYEKARDCIWFAEEHRQLVEWLKDYKRLKELAEKEKGVRNGTPLDDVKAEIAEEICLTDNPYTGETKYTIEHLKLLEILDNIGKADMRKPIMEKIRCNTCKNNDDELSGECYECVKNIQNHYEPEEVKEESEDKK